MFPSIKTRFLRKSSGLKSPSFLKFQKQKRERRHSLTKRRKILKKIFKKMRERSIMRQAFYNIYFVEKGFDSIAWKLIEERFEGDPPPAIVYWFLDN